MNSRRHFEAAPWKPDINSTAASFTCHHGADQSITPGVSASNTPKTQVAIMAGLMICFSRRHSMILKRSLSGEPGLVSQ